MPFIKILTLCFLLPLSATVSAGIISDGSRLATRPTDKETILQATSYAMNAPRLTYTAPGESLHLYKVAFDGTMNDRAHVPLDERQTLVARIARATNAVYYTGAGMQGKKIDYKDALIGYTVPTVARDAAEAFYQQAQQWNVEDPDTVIRVFVTGFSRGSAAARQFMNLIDKEWATRFPQAKSQPHFYAMLYDTVATGQQDTLDLGIPASLDYLVHFIAIDEMRTLLFTPTVDPVPIPQKPVIQAGLAQRINNIYLPGAHSDVGASYSQGIGDMYIVLSEQFLYMMGLTANNRWVMSCDPLLKGKHDSRGLHDKLFGAPDANSLAVVNRPAIVAGLKKQTPTQSVENKGRLQQMSEANIDLVARTDTTRVETVYASFRLTKDKKGVHLLAASDTVVAHTAAIEKVGKKTLLRFWIRSGTEYSKLQLSKNILRALNATPQILSYTLLETTGQAYLAIWLDNRLIEMMPVTLGKTRVLNPEKYGTGCVR